MIGPLILLGACAPKLNAGEWQCPSDGGVADGSVADGGITDGGVSDGGVVGPRDPVRIPWSTGFEDGFCDYMKVAGNCYGNQAYTLVTDPPPHSGRLAAEFKVSNSTNIQSRCTRRGELPESAYYGAWYYIPEPLLAASVWNLFHFERPDNSSEKLWDVTLAKPSGDWELVVFDPLAPPGSENTYRSAERKPVPFGRWFHIQLFLKRATDATGEIALYQDETLLFERKNLRSDASKFTQWYVGDYAEDATPADSSLYVDDVSIRATLSSASATP